MVITVFHRLCTHMDEQVIEMLITVRPVRDYASSVCKGMLVSRAG